MEKSPERSQSSIRAELDAINAQILELEEKLVSVHQTNESGNDSAEDNAQESQADMTEQARIMEHIKHLRLKEDELRSELGESEKPTA